MSIMANFRFSVYPNLPLAACTTTEITFYKKNFILSMQGSDAVNTDGPFWTFQHYHPWFEHAAEISSFLQPRSINNIPVITSFSRHFLSKAIYSTFTERPIPNRVNKIFLFFVLELESQCKENTDYYTFPSCCPFFPV